MWAWGESKFTVLFFYAFYEWCDLSQVIDLLLLKGSNRFHPLRTLGSFSAAKCAIQ